MSEIDLVTALIDKQDGTTDTAFAQRLGISRSMWWLVRRRRQRPGMRLLRGVLREFPDLHAEMLISLRSKSTICNSNEAQQGQEQSA